MPIYWQHTQSCFFSNIGNISEIYWKWYDCRNIGNMFKIVLPISFQYIANVCFQHIANILPILSIFTRVVACVGGRPFFCPRIYRCVQMYISFDRFLFGRATRLSTPFRKLFARVVLYDFDPSMMQGVGFLWISFCPWLIYARLNGG